MQTTKLEQNAVVLKMNISFGSDKLFILLSLQLYPCFRVEK